MTLKSIRQEKIFWKTRGLKGVEPVNSEIGGDRIVVIQVFGPSPGCAKCKAAEKVARDVAQKFEGVTVKKCDIFSEEAEKYNIMMTPTVVVNDMTVEVGKVPSAEKLEEAVKNELEQ